MTQGNNRCSNSIKRREHSDSIPTDLLTEIFSRLPAKSIARFHSLSKLWRSTFHRPYFTDLFMTRSSARPRLLFAVVGDGEWIFYSSPQRQHLYGKSSLVVAADFHRKFHRDCRNSYNCSYASGLVYFSDRWCISEAALRVIGNPITGQYAILPEPRADIRFYSHLGFDPIDMEFKVLLMTYNNAVHHILTLGTDKVKWRNIQCPLIHEPFGREICINGVLYYLAQHFDEMSAHMFNVIVSFDVRSEKFKFIEAQLIPHQHGIKLVNYKGKLGGLELKYGRNPLELYMWILEDEEKQEWSKYIYTLPENVVVGYRNISFVGVTATGEIVLSKMFMTSKSFYVFYFNPERKTLQHLEIQGLGECQDRRAVYTFVDHVEDLRFIDAKQLNSSIYTPSVKNEARSLNIIRERLKPHNRE